MRITVISPSTIEYQLPWFLEAYRIEVFRNATLLTENIPDVPAKFFIQKREQDKDLLPFVEWVGEAIKGMKEEDKRVTSYEALPFFDKWVYCYDYSHKFLDDEDANSVNRPPEIDDQYMSVSVLYDYHTGWIFDQLLVRADGVGSVMYHKRDQDEIKLVARFNFSDMLQEYFSI